MKITRTKVDVSEEKRILSHMITSTPLLARLKGIGQARLFNSPFARSVVTWIWEYYEITTEAPGRAMEDIFHSKAKDLDEDGREMIAEFLGNLSRDWERATPTNVDYSFNESLLFFKLQALQKLAEALEGSVADRNPSLGEKMVAEFTRPEKVGGESIDLLRDIRAIQRAFSNEDEVILRIPGVVGLVIGDLIRDEFVCFQSPPKRGKTWWLMFLSWQATLASKKVVFISLEMGQDQMVRRFWQMITGRSRKGEDAPLSRFVKHGNEKWTIETDMEAPTQQVVIDAEVIRKEQMGIIRYARGGELRLLNYPTGELSLKELKNRLSTMALYDNFIPDLIAVDYADIMDHGPGSDHRHKINNTYLGLRGLASEYKACVATVTQGSGRDSLAGKKDTDESQVAEDYRKIANVTKLVLINQTKDEKARGIYRLSCNTQREEAGAFDTAVCTARLACGRPHLDSKFLSDVDMGDSHA